MSDEAPRRGDRDVIVAEGELTEAEEVLLEAALAAPADLELVPQEDAPPPKQPRIRRGPELEQGRDGRWYVWQGERFWSVTTLINAGLPKPALKPWGERMVAQAAVDQIGFLQQMVRQDPEGAVDWLKRAPFRTTDRKAKLGSWIHEAAEAHILEAPWPEPTEAQAPYLEGFRCFLADFDPTYLAVESPVFSRLHRYAGTLDAILSFEHPEQAKLWGLDPTQPIRALVDIKTGSGIFPEVGLQLAAYRHAETFLGIGGGTEEAPMPEVDVALALHLDPKAPRGYRVIPVDTSEQIYRSFLYVREVARFAWELGPTVVGRAIKAPEDRA